MKYFYPRYLGFLICFLSLQLVFSQPLISTISSNTFHAGDTITFTGNQLQTISQIKLSSKSVSLAAISYNTIDTLVLVIPQNIVQGTYNFYLIDNGSQVSNQVNVTVLGPTINSISSAALETDYRVTIATSYVDGISAVYFGGVRADINSIVYINGFNLFSIAVPYVNSVGAYDISIATTYDITNSHPFSISGLNIPQVIDSQPNAASVGDMITIFGKNFGTITGVTFGNFLVPMGSISLIDSVTFTVQVPFLSIGENGIKVYTKRGESNTAAFQVLVQGPSIASFAPAAAKIGEEVTVLGTNLQNVNAITIGNLTSTGIRIVSANQLTFIIPNGALDGLVGVLSPFGNDVSTNTLQVDTTTTDRGGTIDTTTAIHEFDMKLNDIGILKFQDGQLELDLKTGFSSLSLTDVIGRTVFNTNEIIKGKLLITVPLGVNCFVLLARNESQYFKRKVCLGY